MSAQKKDTINIKQGIPFGIIQKAPIFPGCETLGENSRRHCLQQGISQYISQNFNRSILDSLELEPGKKRIYTQFIFGKDGHIYQVRARSSHKKLEEEAVRVVSLLPKMAPGVHHGRKVNVKYTMPIIFLVEDKATNRKK
ncbi:MAG: hypothetical protein HKN90_08670 [Flavobacteriaceae bacterium]|nr:hypothetical protein [Flavobacteriaceae bacterium]